MSLRRCIASFCVMQGFRAGDLFRFSCESLRFQHGLAFGVQPASALHLPRAITSPAHAGDGGDFDAINALLRVGLLGLHLVAFLLAHSAPSFLPAAASVPKMKSRLIGLGSSSV